MSGFGIVAIVTALVFAVCTAITVRLMASAPTIEDSDADEPFPRQSEGRNSDRGSQPRDRHAHRDRQRRRSGREKRPSRENGKRYC
ncbi:hypothetical protein CA85_44340 [Allorhodopirellula solitaria]|uniref:Uncharacterized protein n=1 Tax=Allorhodopirellula solitaria TaxID=2527987 RepID=A0A5C5X1Z0_9BACT|nr:hypothetical protein CA85_44340 [Allorhodopirellula solitaria]